MSGNILREGQSILAQHSSRKGFRIRENTVYSSWKDVSSEARYHTNIRHVPCTSRVFPGSPNLEFEFPRAKTKSGHRTRGPDEVKRD